MKKKSTIAIMCAASLLGCAVSGNNTFTINEETAYRQYDDPEAFYMSDEYYDWYIHQKELIELARDDAEKQQQFARVTSAAYLSQTPNENAVYAPLNVWFAAAGLAEVTAGDTQKELFAFLGVNSKAELQDMYEALWNAGFVDLPETKEYNAVSLWLSDKYRYDDVFLSQLQKENHISSFAGDLSSEEMNAALKDWVNSHTGHLLEEYTDNLKMNENTILNLVSALYFKAPWTEPFVGSQDYLFDGYSGSYPVKGICKESPGYYYEGERFTAVREGLTDSGFVYFILPDEKHTVADVYASDEMWNLFKGNNFVDSSTDGSVFVRVPTFELSSEGDLIKVMQDLGVKKVFDSRADFSPLSQRKGISLGSARHTAAFQIDKDGVTGAAYTSMMAGAGQNNFQYRFFLELNRPFLFVVTAEDGTILFVGNIFDLPHEEDTYECFG